MKQHSKVLLTSYLSLSFHLEYCDLFLPLDTIRLLSQSGSKLLSIDCVWRVWPTPG